MKNLFRLIPALLFLASCEMEVYDKGDSEYSYMRADFVEAVVDGNKQVEYVVTDEGTQLPLTTAYMAKWIQQADTTYRAVLYYNKVGSRAEALSLSRVTTLSVRSNALPLKEVNTDPLGLESVWLGKNRKYLNLGLILKTGPTENNEQQKLALILREVTTNPDSTRTCHLLLAHSQSNIPEYYSQRVYVSVSMEGLDVDSLWLSLNTYDGLVNKGFSLKP